MLSVEGKTKRLTMNLQMFKTQTGGGNKSSNIPEVNAFIFLSQSERSADFQARRLEFNWRSLLMPSKNFFKLLFTT